MITQLVGRRAARQGLAWGVVFGLFTYTSAVGYAASYRTVVAREVFARALGSNSGLRMLLGPARRIDTVAGFTEWRGVGLLSLIGAVWGSLMATRMLRGEEEAGRWELLLSGAVTRRRAAVQATAGLAIGWVALFVPTAIATVLTAERTQLRVSSGAALAYALTVSASAALFLCIGVLAAQLMGTRRHAAMLAGGFVGAAVVLRMLGDSEHSLAWVSWATPLGWLTRTHPLTGWNWHALVPIAVLAAVALAAGWSLCAVRDVGAGVFDRRADARSHVRFLNSPAGLTARTMRPVALGWCAAFAILGLLFGLVAKSAAQAAAGSAQFRDTLARLGASGSGAPAYLAVTFLVGATLVMLVAGGRAVDARDEEGTGRLDHLLVRPVGRVGWLAQRYGLGLLLAGVCAEVLAVAEWIGVTAQHADVSAHRLLLAGINIIPAAMVVLGVGAMVHGIAPRLTAVVTYALVAWSFLIEFVAQLVSSLRWLRGTSLLSHLAAVPAANPNWTAAAVLIGVGGAAAGLGAIAFARRDLRAE